MGSWRRRVGYKLYKHFLKDFSEYFEIFCYENWNIFEKESDTNFYFPWNFVTLAIFDLSAFDSSLRNNRLVIYDVTFYVICYLNVKSRHPGFPHNQYTFTMTEEESNLNPSLLFFFFFSLSCLLRCVSFHKS